MPFSLDEWLERIRQLSARFEQSFAGLSPEQLNAQPQPGAWSIAQVLDHLITTNETYFPVLDALRAGSYRAPWLARFRWITGFLGKIVLDAVNPDRRRRMKTFPVWEPSYSRLPDDILQRFLAHQNALINNLESARDLISREQVIASPANRNIIYTLPRAVEIIVTHEERHLNQALEVLEIQRANGNVLPLT